jgi:hypothetical protein
MLLQRDMSLALACGRIQLRHALLCWHGMRCRADTAGGR